MKKLIIEDDDFYVDMKKLAEIIKKSEDKKDE